MWKSVLLLGVVIVASQQLFFQNDFSSRLFSSAMLMLLKHLSGFILLSHFKAGSGSKLLNVIVCLSWYSVLTQLLPSSIQTDLVNRSVGLKQALGRTNADDWVDVLITCIRLWGVKTGSDRSPLTIKTTVCRLYMKLSHAVALLQQEFFSFHIHISWVL